MRLGIILSNAASCTSTQSTVHIAAAATAAGHLVRIFEPWDFEIDPAGRVRGRAHMLDAPASAESIAASLSNRGLPRLSVEVDRLDVLLLRANPLSEVVLTFAQLAAAAGVRVYNDPRGLVCTSHKAWLATLPGVSRPRSVVTRSRATITCFASECRHGVVVKPARACGGRGVTIALGNQARCLDDAIQLASRHGDGYLVVQEYLPAAFSGERRLLWLDGQLVGGYLRQRAPGELRHNLRQGASPAPWILGPEDHAVVEPLIEPLRDNGIWFAGIDVIGGAVVEVNTLNPGGLHYASHFSGLSLADQLVRRLEARLIFPPSRTVVPAA